MVFEQQQFLVNFDQKYSATLSPSAPTFFQLSIPNDVDVGILIVESADDSCMTLSVQNISW